METTRSHQLLLVLAPIALGVLLLFHPQSDLGIYEGLRDQVTRWIAVHIGLAVGAGLMAAAAYVLTARIEGRARTVSRAALGIFVVFFIAWEATLGIGAGLMVDQANGVAAADRAPFVDAIQSYFDSPVLMALSAIGNTAWVVAMVAAATGFRRAGAPARIVLLLGFSSVFVMHDAGPVGAIGLACFAAAAFLVLRGEAARRSEVVAPAPVREAVA
jgi:hypothetical protein